jgi:hypothetical protein
MFYNVGMSCGGQYVSILLPTAFDRLLCQMENKMPSEPQHPTVLQPWGYLCSIVIEGDFVPKGVE